MTIGENGVRKELVKTLRSMKYEDLDLSFYSGSDNNGKLREGFDRYGKYKMRIGWGAGVVLTFIFAFITLDSFLPFGRGAHDYNDPAAVWLRENSSWTIPSWAIVAYFLWKANRKVEQADLNILAPAMEKNGLQVLPKGTRFPGDLGLALGSSGTFDRAAFAVMESGKTLIAFGLSYQWWDMSSKNGFAKTQILNQIAGPGPRPTHFIYVAVPELSGDLVYLNPKTSPDWNLLPPMNQKAMASLTQLASQFAVVIGAGGLGVGHAAGQTQIDTSWQSRLSVRSVFETSYKILNSQVADIVEGLL